MPNAGSPRTILPFHVATYDLETPAVLDIAAATSAVVGRHQSVWTKRVTAMCRRIMRYRRRAAAPRRPDCAPPGAGALLVASMNIDPAAEAEFNEWYNTEHLPQLGAVPGVLAARRYRATRYGIGTPLPRAVSSA